VVGEIGGGLNFQRPRFFALLDGVRIALIQPFCSHRLKVWRHTPK
jgi:hypothetical protein